LPKLGLLHNSDSHTRIAFEAAPPSKFSAMESSSGRRSSAVALLALLAVAYMPGWWLQLLSKPVCVSTLAEHHQWQLELLIIYRIRCTY
jgi:hypothetical protein